MNLQDLIEQVTRIKGAKDSVVAVLTEFTAYVEAHKTDPVALQAAIDDLRLSADEIGAAVEANHPPVAG